MDNKNLFYIFLIVFVLLGVYFVSGVTTTLINPTTASWNATTIVNLQYNCTDANYTWFNASLWINGGINATNGNASGLILGGTTMNFTLNLSEAAYAFWTWNVECTGAYGANASGPDTPTQAAANYTFRIDITDPTVALNFPDNASWNTSSSIVFGYTVTETNIKECQLTIDSVAGNASNSTYALTSGALSGIATTLNNKASYTWNIMCHDHVGRNANASGDRTINVDATGPSVAIDMPKGTTIYAGFPIKISCHTTDPTSFLDNIRLTLTKPSGRTIVEYVESGQERTYRGTETGEAGTYTIDCRSTDLASNYRDAPQQKFNVFFRSSGAGAAAEEPEGEITPEGEEAGEEGAAPTGEGAPEVKAPSGKAWIWIVVIVVIILVLYFVLKKKK